MLDLPQCLICRSSAAWETRLPRMNLAKASRTNSTFSRDIATQYLAERFPRGKESVRFSVFGGADQALGHLSCLVRGELEQRWRLLGFPRYHESNNAPHTDDVDVALDGSSLRRGDQRRGNSICLADRFSRRSWRESSRPTGERARHT